jgi:hypothetical protein
MILKGREPGIRLSTQAGTSLSATASRPTLGPTQPLLQWIQGLFAFFGVKRPRREADHPLLSTVEVKNVWSYTSTPANVFTYRT